MIEVWRAVVGYEGSYEVSDAGRVRSLRRRKVVVTGSLTDGYATLRVQLRKDTRGRRVGYVHRIVAEAFLGPCPAGHQVNHIDGNKTNNALTNLEYVTPVENMRHAIATGLHSPRRLGASNGQSKLTPDSVREIRALRGTTTTTAIAQRFGVDHATVADIYHGRRWAWLR